VLQSLSLPQVTVSMLSKIVISVFLQYRAAATKGLSVEGVATDTN